MSAFLDVTEDADMEDGDIDSMMDFDAPDDITGERSFRYGPSGRPIGGDSWLGKFMGFWAFEKGKLMEFSSTFLHLVKIKVI